MHLKLFFGQFIILSILLINKSNKDDPWSVNTLRSFVETEIDYARITNHSLSGLGHVASMFSDHTFGRERSEIPTDCYKSSIQRRPKVRSLLAPYGASEKLHANDLVAHRARTRHVSAHILTHTLRTTHDLRVRIFHARPRRNSCYGQLKKRYQVQAEKVTVPLSRVPGSPGSRKIGSRLIHQNRRCRAILSWRDPRRSH